MDRSIISKHFSDFKGRKMNLDGKIKIEKLNSQLVGESLKLIISYRYIHDIGLAISLIQKQFVSFKKLRYPKEAV